MEILNQITMWIVAVVGFIAGSIGVGGLVAILSKIITNKIVAKINIKKQQEEAFKTGVGKIQEVTFKHSIQPLVDKRLDGIEEKTYNKFEKQNKEIVKQYNNLINIMDKFLAFFEDSMVSEEKKKELRKALDEAKKPVVEDEVVETREIIYADEKVEIKGENKANIIVSR